MKKYKRISFNIKQDYNYTIQCIFKNIDLSSYNIVNIASEIYVEEGGIFKCTYDLYENNEIHNILSSHKKYKVMELIMILKKLKQELYFQIYDSHFCDIVCTIDFFGVVLENIKNCENFYNVKEYYNYKEILSIKNYILSLT